MPSTSVMLIIIAVAASIAALLAARLARRRRVARTRTEPMPAPAERVSADRRLILTETATPAGTRVVLFEDTWRQHILRAHGELQPYLQDILDTVASPHHRENDPWPGRERFFKQHVGPSVWLMVVVSSETIPVRIVTALGYQHGRSPKGWTP